MAKPAKKTESNQEFQQREFPQRIENQRRKNALVLANVSRASAEEKAAARKSEAALKRVEQRLGLKKPTVKAKPAASTAASREKTIGEIIKGAASLTAREKANLEGVKRKAKG